MAEEKEDLAIELSNIETDLEGLESLDSEEWLLDDGIGMNLFDGDAADSGKKGRELDEYIEDIKESARVAIDQSISILTPWFFSNMPQFYYQTTPRDEKIRDLHAIITGHIFESKQKVQLWNRERSKVTFLAPGTDERVFLDIAESTTDLVIKHGAMFTSNDRLLLISSFFTNQFKEVDLSNPKNKAKIEKARQLLIEENQDPRILDPFLADLDQDMVIHATSERIARLFKMFAVAREREDAVTHLISRYFGDFSRLDIAYKKMPITQTLSNVLYLLERYGFLVNRAVMATLGSHSDTPITVFTLIFRHETGEVVTDKFVPFLKLNKAVKTLRWVDTDHFDDLWKVRDNQTSPFSLNECNLVRAISAWVQVFLSKRNPYYYSEERVRTTFERHPELLRALTQYFKARLDPRISLSKRRKAGELAADIENRIGDISKSIEREILTEALSFLGHILKTNYFFPRKTGLAFRMDPSVLDQNHYPQRPFAFFYLIGRGYRGFHVRYRDTARGGLRIVMPRDAASYEASFAGLFDEVIGLAYAQQLKNKDIPEGGAKAVLLLTPGADRETAAMGAVDSLLNLITADPETKKLDPTIIDYLGQEEYIYLGPDENCTNQLIEAFVEQANRRKYMFANAFMSSKPTAGINHKVYGVTSEGVNVYLDNLLQELGIDPKAQSFTVKMTGGPDGDVAGNELKILNREYGENARVVAIGDGFGAACDPAGLDWTELLRLVQEGHPISKFDPAALSSDEKAFVILADTKEHIRIRNTIHATVSADIFIPAGGRPYTVKKENWSQFLDQEGNPSVRGIVEGANIFFTEEAREGLQGKGVLIFKDSSANKCGVICSSFEILASLILTPAEFMEIKDVYVAQVIERLRMKADQEAKLLLREYHERGKRTNLVELSKVLSQTVNRVTDVVAANLEGFSDEALHDSLWENLILGYSPQILREKYADRILNDIPRSYRQAIISADTASRMVYAEGLTWFEKLADSDVVETVKIYIEKERKVQKLLDALAKSDIEDKEDMAHILQYSGARALTQLARRPSPGPTTPSTS